MTKSIKLDVRIDFDKNEQATVVIRSEYAPVSKKFLNLLCHMAKALAKTMYSHIQDTEAERVSSIQQ